MAKLACMSLPYAAHSFERSLEGIAAAGYRYVSFGLAHAGTDVPDETDSNAAANLKTLFERYNLQPVQLIANAQFAPGQSLERAVQRIRFAQELGIPEIITVGTWNFKKFPDERLPEDEMAEKNRAFVERYRQVAEAAQDYNVTITIKPHSGNTATAKDIVQTLQEIGAANVLGCYDPGNVQFYEGVNAAQDFPDMAAKTFSIIAKDHKGERANLDFPVPGTGDVDFLQIFKDWKAAGSVDGPNGAGNVVVERVDGPVDDPSLIDERLRQSYRSLKALMEQAELTVE